VRSSLILLSMFFRISLREMDRTPSPKTMNGVTIVAMNLSHSRLSITLLTEWG
jgi:hypothetical protein